MSRISRRLCALLAGHYSACPSGERGGVPYPTKNRSDLSNSHITAIPRALPSVLSPSLACAALFSPSTDLDSHALLFFVGGCRWDSSRGGGFDGPGGAASQGGPSLGLGTWQLLMALRFPVSVRSAAGGFFPRGSSSLERSDERRGGCSLNIHDEFPGALGLRRVRGRAAEIK